MQYGAKLKEITMKKNLGDSVELVLLDTKENKTMAGVPLTIEVSMASPDKLQRIHAEFFAKLETSLEKFQANGLQFNEIALVFELTPTPKVLIR